VGLGDAAPQGRAGYSSNPPPLGNRIVKNLFISGTPGVGKTQLLREVTLPKREHIGGFYTEHILSGRIRKGFMIRTFDGQDRMLAAKGLKSPHKLGKYGVDLNALENVGVPALKLALMSKSVIVIDEIGSMEMMSERFRTILLECLTSTKPVLATIRTAAQPFSDQVKKFSDTQTIQLTKANYAATKQQVRKWLETQL
jgi:nucleoside-triphosphatase